MKRPFRLVDIYVFLPQNHQYHVSIATTISPDHLDSWICSRVHETRYRRDRQLPLRQRHSSSIAHRYTAQVSACDFTAAHGPQYPPLQTLHFPKPLWSLTFTTPSSSVALHDLQIYCLNHDSRAISSLAVPLQAVQQPHPRPCNQTPKTSSQSRAHGAPLPQRQQPKP